MNLDNSVICSTCEIGWRRTMQDFCTVITDLTEPGEIFAGVYDGHCGEDTARFASATMHTVYKQGLIGLGLDHEAAFRHAFSMVSSQAMRQYSDGSCAAVFSLIKNTLRFANAGDSRLAVLGKKSKELTVVHRLTNKQEKARILQAKGYCEKNHVFVGNMGLEPTRTLGDGRFKPTLVISEPHTGVYEVQPTDRFLILASDALFDVMSLPKINKASKGTLDAKHLLTALRNEALRSYDNVTIVVVKLN
jgi:serine/threonine protein phosphatase PrpC